MSSLQNYPFQQHRLETQLEAASKYAINDPTHPSTLENPKIFTIHPSTHQRQDSE
jgi:hypothetical protein